MRNNQLFALNFQGIQKYDLKELARRKAKPNYDPPLKCDGFCTLCERNGLVSYNGNVPPILSHGCDTDDYESFLGDLSSHLSVLNIQKYSEPVIFLLDAPGGYWDSGVAFKYNEYKKQPSTKHYYWMPHKLKKWPSSIWKKPETSGEHFGDYFAYLMVKHGLTNVYITDVIKCSWENSYTEKSKNMCVETYLNEEVKFVNPATIFCFSRKVEKMAAKVYPDRKRIFLWHPTAIRLSRRHRKTPDEIVKTNDSCIARITSMVMRGNDMWSDELIKMTRDVILEHHFIPYDDAVHFKNHDSRYGSITVSNILANKLLLVDKKTNSKTLYKTADELIEAGWCLLRRL